MTDLIYSYSQALSTTRPLTPVTYAGLRQLKGAESSEAFACNHLGPYWDLVVSSWASLLPYVLCCCRAEFRTKNIG